MKYNQSSFLYYFVFAFIVFTIGDKIHRGYFFDDAQMNGLICLVVAALFNVTENAIKLYEVIGTAMLAISARKERKKYE